MPGTLILVAEHDAEIARMLIASLDGGGFRTVAATDGEIALMHHRTLAPGLILLDVQLPKRSGVEVLAEVRRRGDTPVIMGSTRLQDTQRLAVLELGADDYLVKPFNPREVVARVKAVLRRSSSAPIELEVLRVGDIEVDLGNHVAQIRRGAATSFLDLTLTEHRILAHMARAPRRAFTRTELIDGCLPERDVLERTVDSHVSNLRRKLEHAGAAGHLCVVRGVGYRLQRW